MYLGDIRLNDTLDFYFTTRRFSTGVPFALSGGVISAYVDNSTTQITAGITLTADFDGVTGLNQVRIVASSGNGYTTSTNVSLVVTTGTVDSVSVVGEVVGAFSIEKRSAVMPTVAARTLDVSAGGEAGLDWANIGSPTTAQNLSATNIDVDQVVASVSGAVASVTGNVGGNVTGSVGSVVGNVGGNVTGTIGGMTVAALADFFDTNSGQTYAGSVAGSVVKEIADNAASAAIGTALSTAIADSIPADGTRPSVYQALYMIYTFLVERSVSGTTLTIRKVDGSTSLFTCTLNDATSPTSITRAT